jgi:prepilin signal peptidase PulO-like enzyme (type II secretory pathway)
MELLAMIGAFLGPVGVWFTILIGSLVGVLIAGFYILITKKDRYTQIPFGPFLALGATIYFFFKDFLLNFLM